MQQEEYTRMTDKELLDAAKKMKSFSVTNAFLIGLLGGIIVYSIFKNSWCMLTLIPLYLMYKLINDQRNKEMEELKIILKDRNLKW